MSTNTKTAVVTGAGSGIGYAVAEAFVREGANVVLNGRNEDKLARAAAQLGQPGQLALVAGDVTQPETAGRIVEAAVGRFGRIDVLVNNAGTFESKPFTDYSVEELDSFLGYLRGRCAHKATAARSSTSARFWQQTA